MKSFDAPWRGSTGRDMGWLVCPDSVWSWWCPWWFRERYSPDHNVVYEVWNVSGQCLYIGVSQQIERRIRSHMSWMRDLRVGAALWHITEFDDWKQAKSEEERRLLCCETPLFNECPYRKGKPVLTVGMVQGRFVPTGEERLALIQLLYGGTANATP